jgi:hypothetical protein
VAVPATAPVALAVGVAPPAAAAAAWVVGLAKAAELSVSPEETQRSSVLWQHRTRFYR